MSAMEPSPIYLDAQYLIMEGTRRLDEKQGKGINLKQVQLENQLCTIFGNNYESILENISKVALNPDNSNAKIRKFTTINEIFDYFLEDKDVQAVLLLSRSGTYIDGKFREEEYDVYTLSALVANAWGMAEAMGPEVIEHQLLRRKIAFFDYQMFILERLIDEKLLLLVTEADSNLSLLLVKLLLCRPLLNRLL